MFNRMLNILDITFKPNKEPLFNKIKRNWSIPITKLIGDSMPNECKMVIDRDINITRLTISLSIKKFKRYTEITI